MQDGDIIWKHNTVQAKDEVHLYNTLCYLVNLKIDFKVTELMWLIFLEFLLPICLFQLSCKMFSVNEHGFTYMNFMEENNHIMSTSGREKYRMNNKQMRMDIISWIAKKARRTNSIDYFQKCQAYMCFLKIF